MKVCGMAKRGSEQHEAEVKRKAEEMISQGWRVIILNGKSPDAIAVKDGKIVAVEILKKIKTERTNEETIKRHGRYVWRYQGGFTQAGKRSIYDMFDDVEFSFYKD